MKNSVQKNVELYNETIQCPFMFEFKISLIFYILILITHSSTYYNTSYC